MYVHYRIENILLKRGVRKKQLKKQNKKKNRLLTIVLRVPLKHRPEVNIISVHAEDSVFYE